MSICFFVVFALTVVTPARFFSQVQRVPARQYHNEQSTKKGNEICETRCNFFAKKGSSSAEQTRCFLKVAKKGKAATAKRRKRRSLPQLARQSVLNRKFPV